MVLALLLVSVAAASGASAAPAVGTPGEGADGMTGTASAAETLKGAALPMNANCPSERTGEDAERLGADWLYSWGTDPPLADGIESVPMVWGRFSGCPELGGNSEWVLGFNEPDLPGQANMTPEEGAAYWHQLEQCYPERKLVSPAPGYEPSWLEEMREAYAAEYGEAPRFDALAFHCYHRWGFVSGCRADAEQYADWAQAWGAEGGLWLTEFGYADTDRQEQAEKLQAVVDWVRDEAAVVRYAWFATRYKGDEAWAVPAAYSTALMACESGELTTLGEAYVRIGAEPAVRVFLPAVVR